MKIALVCDRWDARGGGLELWAQQFVAGMRGRGHEMHVICFDARTPAEGATLHLLEAPPGKIARGAAVESAIPGIGADIVCETGVGWTYDVLHPHAGSKLANYRRDLDSRTTSDRFLRRIRPSQWKWLSEVRELENRQHRRASGTVIVSSEMVASDLIRLHAVARDRIQIVPNGVDTAVFSPERLEPLRIEARQMFGCGSETVFLFSARNPVLKGIRPLLEAMRRMRGCRLLIAGAPRPANQPELPNVTFCGYVDNLLLPLAAADAVVQPSYYDTCSLTVLEAWACALPIVTTRWNGVCDLMQDGVEGVCLDEPDHISALTAAMQHLTDPAVRSRMSGPARALAERHTFSHHLDRIEQIYRSLPCRA